MSASSFIIEIIKGIRYRLELPELLELLVY